MANGAGPTSTTLFKGRSFRFPVGISEDFLLNEPPFVFTLNDEEILELCAERDQASLILAVAATSYGPPPPAQEKKSNEDYALSAIIKKADGEEWAFAAVADGVSTRTFWAARASRIACLVAFKVFRQFIALDRNIFEDSVLEDLQESLVRDLRSELNRDKLNLLDYKNVVPANWSVEMYETYKERNELWYNSTLLVTCLGPQAGLIIYAGDGGIELVKVKKGSKGKSGGVDIKEVLRSTEDLTIGSFVSLAVSSKDFRAARISYDDDITGVEVILSSDGVDRTLQMNPGTVTYQDLKLDSSATAINQLQELLTLPQCEPDNFSVARAARYKDKITKVLPPVSNVDKTAKTPPVVDPIASNPGPKRTPPPRKGKIDLYVLLPFIAGCCVGVGSTLAGVYWQRHKPFASSGKTANAEQPRNDSTGQTKSSAGSESPANANSHDTVKPAELTPGNETNRSGDTQKRPKRARRKRSETRKPGVKATGPKAHVSR